MYLLLLPHSSEQLPWDFERRTAQSAHIINNAYIAHDTNCKMVPHLASNLLCLTILCIIRHASTHNGHGTIIQISVITTISMDMYSLVVTDTPSIASEKMKKAMKRRNRAFTNPAITSALAYLQHQTHYNNTVLFLHFKTQRGDVSIKQTVTVSITCW